MTISRTIRKRLRRYALFCLMAATTAGMVETTHRSDAGETHDSGDLCGWIEELSETTFSKPASLASDKTESAGPPQFLAVTFDQELLIDTCSYDAWLAETLSVDADQEADEDIAATQVDSVEVAEVEVAEVEVAEVEVVPVPTSRTSSQFNTTIATIAAAATAGNPIPFGQWTEPFAMVGPAGSHTPEQIQSFQAWFETGRQLMCEFVPVVDFNGEIPSPPGDALALADTPLQVQPPAVENVCCEDPLVGSSPFIVTIEEAYLPYDLADRDIQVTPPPRDADPAPLDEQAAATPQLVWADGLFSTTRHPFCVRSLVEMREPGWSPLAKNIPPLAPTQTAIAVVETPEETEAVMTDGEQATTAEPEESVVAFQEVAAQEDAAQKVAAQEVAAPEILTPKITGSADCLLDELIWNVTVALEDESVSDQWLRPDRIGKKMASLVVSGDRLASRVASELALRWPADAKPAKPIPGSGAKLLARAEAAEQLPAEGLANPFTPEQLAQADAMLWQWVDVAQSVIGDLSDRLDDVTEVARYRGTQNESQRR